MIIEDIVIVAITATLLITFAFLLTMICFVDRVGRTEATRTLTQSNLESGQAPTPRHSGENIATSGHYQSIIDLPSSYFQEQDGKDGQEVCGICLFPVDLGDPVKTIPACKHFFHGLLNLLASSNF
jgi:hypothetical protein